ncbi:MAG: family 78 glycoside hydrolase catalytic domain [Bacteroidia bacterium]|nr:family 78 glycoside hydrolase catalytic domain [Bacteroidia bacterium]
MESQKNVRKSVYIPIRMFFLICLTASVQIAMGARNDLSVHQLKTEYKTNPIDIASQNARLSWELSSGVRNTNQVGYRVQVASTASQLNKGTGLLWDSGKVNSDQSIHISCQGIELISGQQVFWQVTKWIEPILDETDTISTPCPYLRKEFQLKKEIKSARIYTTALGLYELSLNGQKVSDQLFTPGWTSYHKRLQYQVYDVTNQLKSGNNAIGVILGDGWYRGFLIWQGKKNLYGDKTALLFQLKVTYTDGSEEWILSDNSWKSSTGPILKSDIYNGETFDAHLVQSGWNMVGFDDQKWGRVSEKNLSKAILVSSEGSPVRITETIKPIAKMITPKGEVVFDLGQNMVGWVKFSLKGKPGEKITLHHAEVLDKEGNFYLENLRKAKAEDVYLFKGEGVETFEPHFTFHGFRYIRVSDYLGEITVNDLSGRVIHSDMEPTGNFECSDEMINRLQKNIQWGLRGNFLDVPTDCPQRDERLGWTGDAQVFASTACFNMNTAPFYTKWMRDFTVDQKADGSVPWVVPNVVKDGGGTGWSDGYGATGWADASVIIPWEVYQSYGDTRILENQYESMKGWEEYMIRHSGERCIFDYGFHFGDWLAFAEYMSYYYNAPDYGYAGANTDKDMLATCYFYYTSGLMSKIATILGKPDDAKRYADLQPKIKTAFAKEFLTETGRLTSNTQAAYVVALTLGLIPDNKKEIAAERLAKDVKHFGHLTTGFLGTPLICRALSENGYPDLAYMLLFNKKYPSWLYPITKGATTIWERWDCIKPDGTFQDAGMNSFNHYAYGAVGNWMYTTVAGLQINPLKPGYKEFVVNPTLTDQLSFAKVSHFSMYGKIVSGWKTDGNKVILEVEVPANTLAKVYVPAKANSTITENGKPVSDLKEIKSLGFEKNRMVFEVGSGKYRFESEK